MKNTKLHANLKWDTLFKRAQLRGLGTFDKQGSDIYIEMDNEIGGGHYNLYYCSDLDKQHFIYKITGMFDE